MTMMVYQTNECVFPVDDAFQDRTINVLSLKEDGPSEFSLVVSRDALEVGDTLEGYVARQMQVLGSRTMDLKVHGQQKINVDKQQAIQTDFSWKIPEGVMFQRQVAVLVPRKGLAAQQIMIFTGTARDKLPDRWAASLEETLSNLHFKR